ncbi:MAG TPA: hypothetical protein PK256_03040 [Verrucomicrobiota bacterium]|nr:hypothetical protein [Verrucomicrobiota bacterium]
MSKGIAGIPWHPGLGLFGISARLFPRDGGIRSSSHRFSAGLGPEKISGISDLKPPGSVRRPNAGD